MNETRSFLVALIGEDNISKLESEFVSFSDMRVGTIFEMMDLGVPRKKAAQLKTTLNCMFRATGRGNIETMTLEQISHLKIEQEDIVR